MKMGNLKDASDSFQKAQSYLKEDSKEDRARVLLNS